MKTSVSFLSVMTWSRVWEISSQKEKPLLCLNQNQTPIAIRSGKMTEREASIYGGLHHSMLSGFWSRALLWDSHLRKKRRFWHFQFYNIGGFFFSPVSSGEGQEPAFSFLATLASSSSEEMESQLQERVESSRRAVSQIVTVYDKLQEKVELLSRKLNSGGEARTRRQGAKAEE